MLHIRSDMPCTLVAFCHRKIHPDSYSCICLRMRSDLTGTLYIVTPTNRYRSNRTYDTLHNCNKKRTHVRLEHILMLYARCKGKHIVEFNCHFDVCADILAAQVRNPVRFYRVNNDSYHYYYVLLTAVYIMAMLKEAVLRLYS